MHLLDHLEVVVADSSDTLNHPLYVSVTAFLLEILNLLPKIHWDLSGRCGSVICLREAVLLKELLLVSLGLLLHLKHLIDHLLQLCLQLHLHDSNLRGDDMSQLLLNRQLLIQIINEGLHLHEVLHVWLRNLIGVHLGFKVNSLVFLNGLVSQLYCISVFGVEVFLVVRGNSGDNLLGSIEF